MVGDGQCVKLFLLYGDRRSACGDIRQSGQLAYLFMMYFILRCGYVHDDNSANFLCTRQPIATKHAADQ